MCIRDRGFSLKPETLAVVSELEFKAEPPGLGLPLRLLFARPTNKEIAVVFSGETTSELYLTGGLEPRLINGERTTGPLALPEGGALVWLCDASGAQLSNK